MHIKSTAVLTLSVILVSGVIFTTFYKTYNLTPSSSLDANYIYSKSNSSVPLLTATANPIASASIPGDFSFATGRIVSLQDNNTRNPIGIADGNWNLTRTKSTPHIQANSTAMIFVAKFNIIPIEGSPKERYRISNFKMTNAVSNKVADIFNGTVSIHGTADYTGVPVSIKIVGNGQVGIIIIWIDPFKVHNRFGRGPIYGTVYNIG
jgi:hypothetical protein